MRAAFARERLTYDYQYDWTSPPQPASVIQPRVSEPTTPRGSDPRGHSSSLVGPRATLYGPATRCAEAGDSTYDIGGDAAAAFGSEEGELGQRADSSSGSTSAAARGWRLLGPPATSATATRRYAAPGGAGSDAAPAPGTPRPTDPPPWMREQPATSRPRAPPRT
jgi:hypothetical protein